MGISIIFKIHACLNWDILNAQQCSDYIYLTEAISLCTLKGDLVDHSEHTELSEYLHLQTTSSIGRGKTWHYYKPKKMGTIIKAT